MKEKKIVVNTSYPINNEYDLETKLVHLCLDEEARNDILRNKGFRVTTHQGPKKDIDSPTSIYSNKFGETAYSETPYIHRFKCECGLTMGAKYQDTVCPKCKTKVTYIGDDFEYYGYLILDNYHIIQPIMYLKLASFIGAKVFDNIIKIQVDKDADGNIIEKEAPKNEPFFGIGLIGFKQRFYEILEFYRKKKKNKLDMYEDIVKNIKYVFTKSIPVYTIHLRPIKISNGEFNYDEANAIYNILSKNVHTLNKNKYDRNHKRTSQFLYNIQTNFIELYKIQLDSLRQKTGDLRSVFGGRYNFTARAVIIPRPSRVDELTLPYEALAELLRQRIINILVKTNSIYPNDANTIWEKAKNSETSHERTIIKNIINNIIKNSGRGISIILNRNPTIEFGSIQHFYVTGISSGYYIGTPLQILPFFAADFDGDALNVHLIINKAFEEYAIKIFNPRNALYISHNDGYINGGIIHNKDLLININSLRGLVDYNDDQINAIRKCMIS